PALAHDEPNPQGCHANHGEGQAYKKSCRQPSPAPRLRCGAWKLLWRYRLLTRIGWRADVQVSDSNIKRRFGTAGGAENSDLFHVFFAECITLEQLEFCARAFGHVIGKIATVTHQAKSAGFRSGRESLAACLGFAGFLIL